MFYSLRFLRRIFIAVACSAGVLVAMESAEQIRKSISRETVEAVNEQLIRIFSEFQKRGFIETLKKFVQNSGISQDMISSVDYEDRKALVKLRCKCQGADDKGVSLVKFNKLRWAAGNFLCNGEIKLSQVSSLGSFCIWVRFCLARCCCKAGRQGRFGRIKVAPAACTNFLTAADDNPDCTRLEI
jgi:hypothetical protein